MEFGVLGPLQVRRDGSLLPVPAGKEEVLLAALVSRVGEMVPATALVEYLWPAGAPRSAAKSLQNYVLRLRRLLEPGRAGSPAVLVTRGSGYCLAVPPESVDAVRFARLAELGSRASRDGRYAAAVETLEQALALWRGRAYSGLHSVDFAVADGLRLEELRIDTVETKLAAELELGRTTQAVPTLQALVTDHPLRERSWSLLIQALYRAGRPAEALDAYDRARHVLADELGVEPGAELRDLYARVLAQDSSLVRGTSPVPEVPESLRLPADDVFVGRAAEMERLRRCWARAVDGEPVVALVRGMPGSGRRRLLAELASEVAREGGRVVHHDGQEPSHADRDGSALTVVTGLSSAQVTTVAAAGWGSGMLVLTASPSATTGVPVEVVDVGPLEDAEVQTLLRTYLAADEVDEVLPDVLRESGGLPGRVHDGGFRFARRRAAGRVSLAAARAGRVHQELDVARADLRDDVSAFREIALRADAAPADMCPWKGLAAYDVEDARWFVGRERLVADLVTRLATTRLLAVVGDSGSGKSSAVHAGLLAALDAGALPGSEGWTRWVMRPGAHPMSELVRVVLQSTEPEPDRVADLLDRLVYGGAVGSRTLLVVDQAEELWSTCEDPAEREAFLDALTEALAAASSTSVVVVLRADHVARLGERPELAEAAADGTVLVGSPTPPELRRAVEEPAARAGLALDVGLADALVEDAGREPGLLPLFSTALTELWAHRVDHYLTLTAYSRSGGLRGAVARMAEAAFGRLTPAEQEAARVLLLRLAVPLGDGVGASRRRVRLSELEALPNPLVASVVRPLAEARLLSVGAGHVEVAHEALFREWPRLRGWLEDDASARAVQHRLGTAAEEWDRGGRDPLEVWRGARLASGLDFATAHPHEVTSTERAFLEAGAARQDAERAEAERAATETARQNRRLRGLLGGVAVLLVAAVVAGGLALTARERAATEAVVAGVRELTAASAAVLESDPELAVHLALNAFEDVRAQETPVRHDAETQLHAAVTSVRLVETFTDIGGAVAWSPAGDVFVTEGPEDTGLIDVRSAATGDSVRAWPGHDVDVNMVAFSSDGALLATTGDDGALRVWDVATRAAVGGLQLGGGQVWGPSFSPDGSLVAAAWHATEESPPAVLVMEPLSGTVLARVPTAGDVRSTSFSPAGDRLVVAVDDPPQVLVVRLPTGEATELLPPHRWPVNQVAWSPDGRWIASTSADGTARIWDASLAAVWATLYGHGSQVIAVAWSPDSTRLATGGADGTARVWGLDDVGARQLLRLSGRSTRSGVVGLAFSPDGQRLLTGDDALSASVWDVGAGGSAEWVTLPAPFGAFTGVDFTADGRAVVTTGPQADAVVSDLADGHVLLRTGSHGPPGDPGTGTHVYELEASPDGSRIATATDASARIWDAATGDLVAAVEPGAGHVSWSSDGSLLAVPGDAEGGNAPRGGVTTVVDRDGNLVAEVSEGPGRAVDAAALSPDGRLLATGSSLIERVDADEERVTVWDWQAGEALLTLETSAADVEFSPDGSLLATAQFSPSTASVWDVRTRRRVVTLEGHGAPVTDVQFSPDGRHIATGSYDGTARIWDVTTGAELLELSGGEDTVWAVRFSPDGSRLASTSANGLVRVWALDPDDLIDLARRKLTRPLTEAECLQYLHVPRCPGTGG
ncbi:MAG TPA: BTAD domain-containing putative transcriptional regulator [Jiangellales bacterium]|nr:BTAD domain-containing putative transcriptional regulator [Jiangellales bacterium]